MISKHFRLIFASSKLCNFATFASPDITFDPSLWAAADLKEGRKGGVFWFYHDFKEGEEAGILQLLQTSNMGKKTESV